MRRCTKEDIESIVDEKPALRRIFKALLGTEGFQSTEQIAKEAGLPVELAQEALDFLERKCEEGDFENPITPRVPILEDLILIPLPEDRTRILQKIELERSVKRTKRWWSALSPYERTYIVRIERRPRDYHSEYWKCPCCYTYLSEVWMVCDRGLCVGCAAKYNHYIVKANNSLQPSSTVV